MGWRFSASPYRPDLEAGQKEYVKQDDDNQEVDLQRFDYHWQ
jgi:hypothetical protein